MSIYTCSWLLNLLLSYWLMRPYLFKVVVVIFFIAYYLIDSIGVQFSLLVCCPKELSGWTALLLKCCSNTYGVIWIVAWWLCSAWHQTWYASATLSTTCRSVAFVSGMDICLPVRSALQATWHQRCNRIFLIYSNPSATYWSRSSQNWW